MGIMCLPVEAGQALWICEKKGPQAGQGIIFTVRMPIMVGSHYATASLLYATIYLWSVYSN